MCKYVAVPVCLVASWTEDLLYLLFISNFFILICLCCMFESRGVFTVQVKPKFTTESHYYYPFYTEIRLKICVCRILNQLGPAGACQGLQAPRCVSWRHTGVLGRLTSAFHRLHHISGLTLGPAEARRHYPWKKC